MERFQSTKTIEEHKQKPKNANTTILKTQWDAIALSVDTKERPSKKY